MVRSTRSGDEPDERAASTRSRGTRDKPCAQRDEDNRRMLNGIKQDDAIASEQRIGRARGWRKAKGTEQRAGWAEQMQPGQRHDLRRDHQRQQKQKTQRPAPWQIGHGNGDGEGRADHKRQQRAEEGRVQRIQRGTDGRRA